MYRTFLILVFSLFQVQCSVFRRSLFEKISRRDVGTNVVASVREYPSELHKCTASFIKPDVLLTVAACIYSHDPSNLFVRASSKYFSDKPEDGGNTYNISRIETHPNFVKTPIGNDIGLIFIQSEASDVTVFTLPQVFFLPEANIPANIFQWKFSDNRKDYYLHFSHVFTIPSAKCTIVFEEYIDGQHICVAGENEIIMGSNDKGSPLTTRNKHHPLIMGLYEKKGRATKLLIEVFQSIVPFVGWINEIIDSHHKTPTSAALIPPKAEANVITTTSDVVTSEPDTSRFAGRVSVSLEETAKSQEDPMTSTTPGGSEAISSETNQDSAPAQAETTSSETNPASGGSDTTPAEAGMTSSETGPAPDGSDKISPQDETASSDTSSATENPDAMSAAGISSDASGAPAPDPEETHESLPPATNLKIEGPDLDAFDYDTIQGSVFESDNLGPTY